MGQKDVKGGKKGDSEKTDTGKRSAEHLDSDDGAEEEEEETTKSVTMTAEDLLLLQTEPQSNAAIKLEFRKELQAQKDASDKNVARMRRDQEATADGNKWHKTVNLQIDVLEDALEHIKSAERGIRSILVLMPTKASTAVLLAAGSIKIEGLEVEPLRALLGVDDILRDVASSQEILAKRLLQLQIVRSADNAQLGYRALEVMASYGAIDPGSEKALKEAARQIEQEDKERKSKKASKAPYRSGTYQDRPWGGDSAPKRGGWGSHAQNTTQREPERGSASDREFAGAWNDYRRDPAPPRGGSQSMAPNSYSRGKGASRGNSEQCHQCGRMGHWQHDCWRYN
jgi:hypothetical protein